MNRWLYPSLVLTLVPLQATWVEGIRIHYVKPDLILIIIFFIGFSQGVRPGVILGLVLGGMTDFFSGGPAGMNLFFKPLLGFISGVFGRYFLRPTGSLVVGLIFLLSLISGMLSFLTCAVLFEQLSFIESLRWTIVPEALYNALIGGLLNWAVISRRPIRAASF